MEDVQVHPPAGRPMLQGVTVLLVEDHRDTREVYASGLRRQGARVVEAGSAQVALLQLPVEHPDVLLVDLELPDVDGVELIRVIRALLPEDGGRVPAVALTVHNQPEQRGRSIMAGFQLHLAKPMDPADLAQIIAGLLNNPR